MEFPLTEGYLSQILSKETLQLYHNFNRCTEKHRETPRNTETLTDLQAQNDPMKIGPTVQGCINKLTTLYQNFHNQCMIR